MTRRSSSSTERKAPNMPARRRCAQAARPTDPDPPPLPADGSSWEPVEVGAPEEGA